MNDLAVSDQKDLATTRNPEDVVSEAKRVASVLRDVISKKSKPVFFNGEQFLEFEDWAMLGRFYGITAKVMFTTPLCALENPDIKLGYEARAVAIHIPTGQEISAAEAMCMFDERNWSGKPLFQLRSMAQTRACAKALRNVLSWVVVLAGYKATPAEEMIEPTGNQEPLAQKIGEIPPAREKPEGYTTDKVATGKTIGLINVLMKKFSYPEILMTGFLESKERKNLDQLTQKEASTFIEMLNKYNDENQEENDDEVPF